MGTDTKIAWAHHTFNPWMGCTKVSDGCKFCYAEELTTRRMGLSIWGPTATRQVTSKSNWAKPRRWHRDAIREHRTFRVFCASLCDVFEDHPVANAARPYLWELIEDTPLLQWLLLTKRPERIPLCLPDDWGTGWPNVWLGTSIEDARVIERADILRMMPAVVRFISYEPALGPLDALDLTGIDWVIYGGESGPHFRPENKDWARTMRDKCKASGVAFFHKQSAARFTETGTLLDGELLQAFPIPRESGMIY